MGKCNYFPRLGLNSLNGSIVTTVKDNQDDATRKPCLSWASAVLFATGFTFCDAIRTLPDSLPLRFARDWCHVHRPFCIDQPLPRPPAARMWHDFFPLSYVSSCSLLVLPMHVLLLAKAWLPDWLSVRIHPLLSPLLSCILHYFLRIFFLVCLAIPVQVDHSSGVVRHSSSIPTDPGVNKFDSRHYIGDAVMSAVWSNHKSLIACRCILSIMFQLVLTLFPGTCTW